MSGNQSKIVKNPKGKIEDEKKAESTVSVVPKNLKEIVVAEDEGISYSVRSVAVDYLFIKTRFNSLMKTAFPEDTTATGICKAWGYSLNNESLRNINGRHVSFKNQECTYEQLLDILSTQEELETISRADAIKTGKSVVTISRIARAYAPENRQFLKKHPNYCRFPEEVRGALGAEFGFPNVMFACDLTELEQKYEDLHKFYENWQAAINKAYSKGYIKETFKKRDWVGEFESYVKFLALKRV